MVAILLVLWPSAGLYTKTFVVATCSLLLRGRLSKTKGIVAGLYVLVRNISLALNAAFLFILKYSEWLKLYSVSNDNNNKKMNNKKKIILVYRLNKASKNLSIYYERKSRKLPNSSYCTRVAFRNGMTWATPKEKLTKMTN